LIFFTSLPVIDEKFPVERYFSAALTFLERARRNEEVQIV
jgi:hypothetical protein